MTINPRSMGLGAAFLFLLAGATPAWARPTFTGLGVLAGADSSGSTRLSADGSVVVGASPIGGVSSAVAFRWTEGVGMSAVLPGGCHGFPTGISTDGSIVVGKVSACPAIGSNGGFYHTPSQTQGGTWQVEGLSHTGVWWVGSTTLGIGADATYWRLGGAFTVTPLPGAVVYGNIAYAAADIPDNGGLRQGLVVVGQAWCSGGPNTGYQAFRWTDTTGTASFGPGTFAARSVTPDGAILVGELGVTSATGAFRWTQAGGIQNLGAGWRALATSDDGGVIVGVTTPSAGAPAAFIWTPDAGARPLAQALGALGVDLTGWNLTEATGVSADGRSISGTGTSPAGRTEAFLVRGFCHDPVILQHPADQSVGVAQVATFSVQISGQDITYRWQRDGADLTDGGRISGASTPTLTITSTRPADDGAYRAIVTTACGSTASLPGTLHVNCPSAVDFDGNGSLTPSDVAAFVAVWFDDLGTGQLRSDWTGNGVVNPTDVAAYLNAWFTYVGFGC